MTAFTLAGSLIAAAPAQASNFGIEVNGTFRMTSDGGWAQTNQVYMDEKTDVQTWTISSSCTTPYECTGQVTSDRGWTAPMHLGGSYWVAEHDIPDWVPCPGGGTAPGHQMFMFWGQDPIRNERSLKNRDFMVGRNITKGPSGACGVNKEVDIELPLKVERLS